MAKNKYIDPHLFKGTRITAEEGETVPGLPAPPSELVCVPCARLWQLIKGVEMLGNSKLVLGAEAPKSVTLMIVEGGYFYVTDPYDLVLAAWNHWLNTPSLHHRQLLN